MAWKKTRTAPIVRFIEKLSSVYVKAIELHAAKQTHKALLQAKSLAHSERKRRERK
jgi:hypothetical protein